MQRPESALARVERLKAVSFPIGNEENVKLLQRLLLMIDASDRGEVVGTVKELQPQVGGSLNAIKGAIRAGEMTGALAIKSAGSDGRIYRIDWGAIPDSGPLTVSDAWSRREREEHSYREPPPPLTPPAPTIFKNLNGPISKFLAITGLSHAEFDEALRKGNQNAVSLFAADVVFGEVQAFVDRLLDVEDTVRDMQAPGDSKPLG